MLPSQHWAHHFSLEAEDIEYILNFLLEKETPLSSYEIAHLLVQQHIEQQTTALEEHYKDALVYTPSTRYEVGQKLIFPHLDYASAIIKDVRTGENKHYGDFKVAKVEFTDHKTREFAFDLATPHKLSEPAYLESSSLLMTGDQISVDDVMEEVGDQIVAAVEETLKAESSLAFVTRKWFPKDLVLQLDEGHMNLAEAVLDINGGGPLKTEDVLEQMGGIGNYPTSLQMFSINVALNNDKRFDEVGPAGEVLWYLARMEPPEVQSVPSLLRYTTIDYDPKLLTSEMRELELELGDELSDIDDDENIIEGAITLIYPHRRAGTLPLSSSINKLFPTAGRSPRIWITLVDQNDNEEFVGWIVPASRYVYGLGPIYRKYSVPIGAYITIRRSPEAGKILVDVSNHRARTEWIRLASVQGDQLSFENSKRSIGTDYDDLMIVGVDNLEALDALVETANRNRKSLVAIMRMLIPGLSRLTPQSTVHLKTIYSAVNMIRRCPPGPIMAILEANPDFENVGGHYWKLASD